AGGGIRAGAQLKYDLVAGGDELGLVVTGRVGLGAGIGPGNDAEGAGDILRVGGDRVGEHHFPSPILPRVRDRDAVLNDITRLHRSGVGQVRRRLGGHDLGRVEVDGRGHHAGEVLIVVGL